MCGHEKISAFLHQERGYFVLWPGQDIRVAGGDEIYRQANANIELVRMHEDLLWNSGRSWIDFRFPRFYNAPYPGPEEFLAKFPESANILMTDPRAMLMTKLWIPYITHLVFIERNLKDTCSHLEVAYGVDKWPHYNRIDWEANCRAYLQRFEDYRDQAITVPFADLWKPEPFKAGLDKALGHSPLTCMGDTNLCYTKGESSSNERDVVHEPKRNVVDNPFGQNGSSQVVPVTGEAEASYLRPLSNRSR